MKDITYDQLYLLIPSFILLISIYLPIFYTAGFIIIGLFTATIEVLDHDAD